MVIPHEERAISRRRVLKYMVRQAGQTRQVEGTGENNICYLHSDLRKKLKERKHLNRDEEPLHKRKLLVLY